MTQVSDKRLPKGFATTMPDNWPAVLLSRADATYLNDTEGTRDLLIATAVYLAQSLRSQPAGVMVKPSEWHRAGEECILLYTLKQDGWRRGEPAMVNDITIRIENANGSSHDLSPIADAVLSALTEQQGEVKPDAWQSKMGPGGKWTDDPMGFDAEFRAKSIAAGAQYRPLYASPSNQEPVAVREEMVERAYEAFVAACEWSDWDEPEVRGYVRAALTAALSQPQGGIGMARPFFSYYGAKWTGAKHYGAPRHDLVIEPFAGSASYSTRWECKNVRLYDLSPEVCDLWDWLIRCSAEDVARIPDAFEHYDEVAALPRGPQLLVRFWVSKGRAEPSSVLSPWYFEHRNVCDCKVWGPAVKRRVVEQKPLIEGWTIERKAWWEIPVEKAHWHIDPPYNNAAGSRYPFSSLSYSSLAAWCRGLPGHVDVCENVGADWLPFTPLYEVVTSRGRRSGAVSQEAVWSSQL